MQINVAVMQGWAGGKWHTRDFEAALVAAGYAISDVPHADIVIAHSTACYDLNQKSPAMYYFLIDPPYWPGKSILKRYFEGRRVYRRSVRTRFGWKYVFKNTLWELAYIFAKPNYTLLMFKHKEDLGFLNNLVDKHTVVIRNDNDLFCTPAVEVAVPNYAHIQYVKLPGEHDDYYTNPQPYIDLLPKEL